MKRFLWVSTALLAASLAWGQNMPKGPGSLTDQGFTEDEAKAVEADLKGWEQSNREWEADLQLIDAQRNKAMVKEALDKSELEKTFRAQYDLFLQRDLARIDLSVKWRSAYGLEKARFLEGRLRGPQGQPGQVGQPGQPGQANQPNQGNQPNQPQGPASKKP